MRNPYRENEILTEEENAVQRACREAYFDGFIAGKKQGYHQAMIKVFERILAELDGEYKPTEEE